jgi:hypothetical protein
MFTALTPSRLQWAFMAAGLFGDDLLIHVVLVSCFRTLLFAFSSDTLAFESSSIMERLIPKLSFMRLYSSPS